MLGREWGCGGAASLARPVGGALIGDGRCGGGCGPRAVERMAGCVMEGAECWVGASDGGAWAQRADAACGHNGRRPTGWARGPRTPVFLPPSSGSNMHIPTLRA